MVTLSNFIALPGAITDYSLIQMSIWVFFHILSIYFLIFHPVRAKMLLNSRKLKYVHLCIALLGLLAPLLGSLTTILHDEKDALKMGYGVVLYNPHACRNTKREILFYTVILPFNFLLTMSVSFLVLVLWKLLKVKLTQLFTQY